MMSGNDQPKAIVTMKVYRRRWSTNVAVRNAFHLLLILGPVPPGQAYINTPSGCRHPPHRRPPAGGSSSPSRPRSTTKNTRHDDQDRDRRGIRQQPVLSFSTTSSCTIHHPSPSVSKYLSRTPPFYPPSLHTLASSIPNSDYVINGLDASNLTSSSSSNPDNFLPTSTIPKSLSKRTAEIAIPALIAMLADPVLSLMDTALIGRIGSIELAALGACTSIFSLFFSAFRATTQATTSLVASAENESTRQKVIAISLRFGLVTGTIVMVTLFLIGGQALQFMGVSRNSPMYRPACDYLFTRLWAAPAVLYIGVAEGIFRGSADTMTPLRAAWVAALLNLILDPLLMFTFGWQVKGAAAATAVAQIGAAATYAITLRRRKWLPTKTKQRINSNGNGGANNNDDDKKVSTITSKVVVKSILAANAAMLWKQGSLLVAWAYATSRATRLGAGAAHQIGLSVWLIFAFVLDAPAVAAQVLRSNADLKTNPHESQQLQRYFWKLATLVGFAAMIGLRLLDHVVPQVFSSDLLVRENLRQLMPHLAWSQVLVSLTLVTEGLAAGAQQFRTLAIGTTLATMLSIYTTTRQTSIAGIWSFGITSLFVGRLITACIAIVKPIKPIAGTTNNGPISVSKT